jgi:SAM-dependent methyltransferase
MRGALFLRGAELGTDHSPSPHVLLLHAGGGMETYNAHAMHDRVFNPAESHRLEDPERLRFMPPAEVVAALELAPGMTVADVGAGTGYFALPVAQATSPGGRVFAVDVQREMLTRLDNKLRQLGASGNISLVEGDATDTTLPDASCDRVLIANVWHELGDPEGALREFARVLRAKGRLVLLDWRADVPARSKNAPRAESDPPGPPAEHRIAVAEVAAMLGGNGWNVLSQRNVGGYSYLVVAERANGVR